MVPLEDPNRRNDPAVSYDVIGAGSSCDCQCWVIEFQTPILPVGDKATSCVPMKNNESTDTFRSKVPTSTRFPDSEKSIARILCPNETAIIVVAGSPLAPLLVARPTEPILALMATRSMADSKYGLQKKQDKTICGYLVMVLWQWGPRPFKRHWGPRHWGPRPYM